jgi:hypothetical protein
VNDLSFEAMRSCCSELSVLGALNLANSSIAAAARAFAWADCSSSDATRRPDSWDVFTRPRSSTANPIIRTSVEIFASFFSIPLLTAKFVNSATYSPMTPIRTVAADTYSTISQQSSEDLSAARSEAVRIMLRNSQQSD